ncbi:MAG TPA: fluoride efflux transporter CrcB [Baekduia sp.]|uniref:fluoride efflux transporter CrcB n=1 Tax=Baekduia sp. TaxID=2600305 RepID=UPI002D792FB2|nr:fluoride efflux transporter CrcB [Baekduia sp.]HET6505838.1 fluoride efflux transporter CrcB [Baekduia sp.]
MPPALELRLLSVVFCGGCVGTLARAGMTEAIAPSPGHWPWATFVVNVVGAFVLGWIATHRGPADHARQLIGTGFCGALTTFSTMQLEVLRMLDASRVGLALLYVSGSVAAGLTAAYAGSSRRRSRV